MSELPQESLQPLTPVRRRWYRVAFGLKTLMVLVVVLAVPLGYVASELRLVHERQAVRTECEHISQSDSQCWFLEDHEGLTSSNTLDWLRVSKLRTWLGDKSCIEWRLTHQIDPLLIERVKQAYPEASIKVFAHDGQLIDSRNSLYLPDTWVVQ